jgi:ABC-type dipeptide/oligopeptide/nickel transport system permease subunit
VVGPLGAVAGLAPILAPHDPSEQSGRPCERPSGTHPLGTNDIGQDILSELIYGTRISLFVGLLAAAAAIGIGTVVGVAAGYFPRLGAVLMRGVDVVLILPFLPLLIVLAAYMGRSITTTAIVIALVTWASPARIIRSQVMSLAHRDYVSAARGFGARASSIIRMHVLPKTLLLATGQFVQATSAAILLESSLAFLGLGDPLQKSWGSILYWAQARGAFLTPAWLWWVLPPGLLIMMASLGFALLGFALEQRVNPLLRRQ